MTLIAGVKCVDGFVVAADTAVTTGSTVYHGEKLHHYQGEGYKLVVACSGELTYARMASQQIRDAAAALANPTVADLKAAVIAVLVNVFAKHIFPHWAAGKSTAPRFSLIVGLEAKGDFKLLISEDTAVEEVGTYAFQGSGAEIAQYLAETLMRSRGNTVLPFFTAAAVQLTIEIFSTAKQYAESVGLDTTLIAWRTADSYVGFSMPIPQPTALTQLAIIQENIKAALWEALNPKSMMSETMIAAAAHRIDEFLTKIWKHTSEQGERTTRFIRYWLMPDGWQMADLDPNAGLPPQDPKAKQ